MFYQICSEVVPVVFICWSVIEIKNISLVWAQRHRVNDRTDIRGMESPTVQLENAIVAP